MGSSSGSKGTSSFTTACRGTYVVVYTWYPDAHASTRAQLHPEVSITQSLALAPRSALAHARHTHRAPVRHGARRCP
eukprot:3682975-Prymnesium_polylepis.1